MSLIFYFFVRVVTLPVLRSKVATEMGVEEESLRDAQIKALLLETFQDFLLNPPIESDTDLIESSPVKEKAKKKERTEKEPKEKKTKEKKKRTMEATKVKVKKPTKEPKKSAKNESQIDRLKSYIFKCGVRKVW